MKKVLIISPHFPPVNAPDMHRVRMSLPYYIEFGWTADIIVVKEQYVDLPKDKLLVESIPSNLKIHKINAFSKKITSKVGLGSLGLRSIWNYYAYVNNLLAKEHFDLIYFSTTEFTLTVLGAYWNKKFKIPYVIDIQDEWHTDYYQDKRKKDRPPKYWFSYRLNRLLEPIAMRNVSAIISVNQQYIDGLKNRYDFLKNIPFKVIPFSSSISDFKIALKNQANFPFYFKKNKKIKIAYIGVAGSIMKKNIRKLLIALKSLVELDIEITSSLEFYFLGTDYAPNGKGTKTVVPIAKKLGLDSFVFEMTDRLGFYNTINHLQKSDALLMIGSDNPTYLGSKLWNLLKTNKKIFAILHEDSPANIILSDYKCVTLCNIQQAQKLINMSFKEFIQSIIKPLKINNKDVFEAKEMTEHQCLLFDKVINRKP